MAMEVSFSSHNMPTENGAKAYQAFLRNPLTGNVRYVGSLEKTRRGKWRLDLNGKQQMPFPDDFDTFEAAKAYARKWFN